MPGLSLHYRAACGALRAALCAVTARMASLATLAMLVLAALLATPGIAQASPERLADIETRLRGKPQEAAPAFEALASAQPPGSPLQVQALLLRGLMLVRTGDAAGVERAATDLADTAQAPAVASLLRAAWLARHGALGSADRLAADAMAHLAADAPPPLRLQFTIVQAGIRQSLGRLDDAVRMRQEASRLADSVGPDWQRAEAQSRLAYTLWLAQQPAQAWAANQRALALAATSADALALSIVHNTQGILLSNLQRPTEELAAMQAAITYARQAGAPYDELLTMANLADHYLKHGDNATALRLSMEALPLARSVRDPGTEAVALANAGLAQIALGRRDEGLRLARDSLLILQRNGSLPLMVQLQQELGSVLERAGFLADAWTAFSEHRRLADDMFQRQHQQAVLELQEEFDHQDRERAMARLRTDTALGEASLRGRALQQRLWAVAVVAALLLLAVAAALLHRMRHSNAALLNSNALLQVASERDPLTGLANRRHLQRVLGMSGAAAAATQAAADGTAPALAEGALLLLDIDHFKRINDRHGHAAGDSVLVDVAGRLRAVLREHDLLVRWGGEEFLVLVRGAPAQDIEALAERLLHAIAAVPMVLPADQGSLDVTASAGFATFPLRAQQQPMSWERAIDLVDAAMYLAKAHGRNRAYGVRQLSLDGPLADRPRPGTLDSAWRQGQAELAVVAGPGAGSLGDPVAVPVTAPAPEPAMALGAAQVQA